MATVQPASEELVMAQHNYSQKRQFDRVMLLLAAIAQNPGIGNRRTDAKGRDAMLVIQEKMAEIAAEQGIEYAPVSAATLRKDLSVLKQYGVMPKGKTQHSGYYLGQPGREGDRHQG